MHHPWLLIIQSVSLSGLELIAIACTVRSPGFSRNGLALEPFRLKAGLQTSVR